MKKILLLTLLIAAPCWAAPEDFKPVLFGRKDLIRNEVIINNNDLCKHMIDSFSLQTTSLNKQLFILLDENKELVNQLKQCQTLKKH